MFSWEDEENLAWELAAREAQQRYCDTWGSRKWDVFLQSERALLEARVGLALFGVPDETDSQISNDMLSGYKKKQVKVIVKLCDMIIKKTKRYANYGQVKMTGVFVSCKSKKDRFTFPLIRVLKYDYADDICNHRFFDSNCRMYRSWDDFLSHNKLPHSLLLFPTNGIYTSKDGKVVLSRGESKRWFTTTVATFRPWGPLGLTGMGLEPTRVPGVVNPTVAGTAMKSALFVARTVSTKRSKVSKGAYVEQEQDEQKTDSEQQLDDSDCYPNERGNCNT